MPVSVGEVEAVLKARDEMSPAMQLAAARVADLEYKLGTLGTSSVTSFGVMNAQLAVAQEKFDKLKAASDDASGGLNQLGQKLGATGEQMTQLESIATRLATRFVILAALRWGVQFIEDLYNNADALIKMSDNMEVSTDKLQEWQYAAERSGVPMNTLTQAADTLGKNLASGKDSVVNALEQLGLSYEKIWQMDPGERFDKVAIAVAGVEDKLVRTGLEVALFGTDKLDGLVKHLVELERQSDATGKALDKATIQTLSDAKGAYAQAYEGLKNMASGWLANSIEATAYFMTLLRYGPAAAQYEHGGNAFERRGMGDSGVGGDPTEAARLMANSVPHPGQDLPDQFKAPGSTKEEIAAQAAAERDLAKSAAELEYAERQADQFIEAAYKEQIMLIQKRNKEGQSGYGAEEQIQRLVKEGEAIARVAQIAMDGSNSKKQAAKIDEEATKLILNLIQQEIELSNKLAKVNNDMIQSELAARAANNAAGGQSVRGDTLTEELTAADQAERKYEAGLERLEVARRKGISTVEQERELQRQFYDDLTKLSDAATQKELANSAARLRASELAAAGIRGPGINQQDLAPFNAGSTPNALTPAALASQPGRVVNTKIDANINVSGVLDPATVKTLSKAVSDQLMSDSQRKFGSA